MSNRLKLLREKATRPRRTVELQLDGEVREQIEAVEDSLDRLAPSDAPVKDRRMSTKSNAEAIAKLQEELESLRAQALETTLWVVMEGLSDTAWLALKAQHPVVLEEGEKPRTTDLHVVTARFNIDTIRKPLAKACIVGYRERPDADAPVLTDWSPDFIDWLLDFASTRQLKTLSDMAYALCERDDAVPLPRRPSATQKSAEG